MTNRPKLPLCLLAAAVAATLPLTPLTPLTVAYAQTSTPARSDSGKFPPQTKFAGDGDHRHMMQQLGIRALRPGADPNRQDAFDEASADRYPLPELLVMKNGAKVMNARQLSDRPDAAGRPTGGRRTRLAAARSGRSVAENRPAFVEWVGRFIRGRPTRAARPGGRNKS